MNSLPPFPLETAQERLLALADPLPVEHVDVEGALGRYLAHPLSARRTQPPADVSAMDGYAMTGPGLAGPWTLIGESAAGHPYAGSITAGEAVRISTGAILPGGARAVILQEDIARDGALIRLVGEPPEPMHKHIRHRGMDFVESGEVMVAGTRIGPAQAALARSAGHRHLPVRRLPRIVVMDSGDELAADPECCEPHQVPASNGAMLLAMTRSLAADARRIGPVADTMQALTGAFEEAVDADVIVTSGGASVGDHDLVRPALEKWGAELDFWRVAIKPGKPILVATRYHGERRQIILGLPGNPVSSFVTAYHFLLPLLRHMSGARQALPMRISTRLGGAVRANGPRREFLRGWWDGERVMPQTVQDSGALASLAGSNVLIDRSSFAPAGGPGDPVGIFLLDNGGFS